MEMLLPMAIITALNVTCFLVGAMVGQKVVKGEKIELPKVNPMDIYKEHQSKKAAEQELNKLDTIMRNIERYDGTAAGQEDVPK
jgi:hypothetical protein